MNRPQRIVVGDTHRTPQEAAEAYRKQGIDASVRVRHNQSKPDDEILCIGALRPPPVHHSVRSFKGFTVGDLVRLSRSGLAVCHGLQTPEEIEAQVKGVRLLEIYPQYPDDATCCGVELEPPLDKFLDLCDIEKV